GHSTDGLAFLTIFVGSAQPFAALTQAQTAAQNVSGSLKTVALSAEQKAACKMLGMSGQYFAKINQTESDSK
ncbi:phage protease, partial [Kingella kingae]|uniref:phage protease n=1 Tax=Kingella kingae TaxID=504 RepID=UPI002E32C344